MEVSLVLVLVLVLVFCFWFVVVCFCLVWFCLVLFVVFGSVLFCFVAAVAKSTWPECFRRLLEVRAAFFSLSASELSLSSSIEVSELLGLLLVTITGSGAISVYGGSAQRE
jgi:hypothetical protein